MALGTSELLTEGLCLFERCLLAQTDCSITHVRKMKDAQQKDALTLRVQHGRYSVGGPALPRSPLGGLV